MVMETERLVLRPWEETDVENLFRYACDPDVGPRAGWPPHTSVEDSREVIRTVLMEPETFAVVLREAGHAVGSIGLTVGDARGNALPDDEAELGYWIGRPYWGRGLVPEAAREMIRHGFEDLGLACIWCAYYEGNEQSRRVQEKLGFRYHHTDERGETRIPGVTYVEHVSRLGREAWEASRPAPRG